MTFVALREVPDFENAVSTLIELIKQPLRAGSGRWIKQKQY